MLIERKYKSIVRQTRVKNHLGGLKVQKFIKNNIDTAAALTMVYRRIITT